MSANRTEIETLIEHPLEETFDIEPGTTISTKTERSTELTVTEQYDEKDEEIESQFQEIYDAAMAAFEDQCAEAEVVEGKYKARNMEVATQLLNSALHAAKEKANQKKEKDKNDIAKNKITKKVTNNNVFMGSHQELLDAAEAGTIIDPDE
jgi:predicted oxidoreductase (fatty acid repression mutant protein)